MAQISPNLFLSNAGKPGTQQIEHQMSAGPMKRRTLYATNKVAIDPNQALTTDATSDFFRPTTLTDRNPVFVQALTTSHPDTVIRRSGVVVQLGKYKGQPVYFNPKANEWRRLDSDKSPKMTNSTAKGNQSMQQRVKRSELADFWQKAPMGVIHVFGDEPWSRETEVKLDPKKVTGAGEEKDKEEPETLERLTAAPSSGALTPFAVDDDIRTIDKTHKITTMQQFGGGGGSDGQHIGFDSSHQQSIIKQYLTRAIPAAAQRTGAVIVLGGGSTSTAENIGVGLSALPAGKSQITPVATAVSAIAISPFEGGAVKSLCQNITHHVLVRRSTMCRTPQTHQQSGLRSECKGWRPNDDGTCAFCNELAEWHVPYQELRKLRRNYQEDVDSGDAHDQISLKSSSRAKPDTKTNQSNRPHVKLDLDQEIHVAANNEAPDAAEMDIFVSRFVDQLSTGYRPELVVPGKRREPPPERPQIPVVVILVGGNLHTAKKYLAQCLTRRHTLLIIEGSGGYADLVCSIKRQIESVFPNAGRDEIRRYSTALDPLTSEILGNFDLVHIIKRGAKNEEIIRQIEGALKGDSALMNVWSTYSMYSLNEKQQEILYTIFNVLLMLLSLLVTFLTALQTFLLLRMVKRGESVPPTAPAPADERGTALLIGWTVMQWSIIILPIMISALQAMMVKSDFGGKWIALRTTSARLLSEIYKYRTSCLMYKEVEVDKHNGGDERSYTSKEDLLQQKAHELTEQLLHGACRQLKLTRAKEVVPSSILAVDDGFSALTPDHYVRVRLKHMIEKRERSAAVSDRWVDLCQYGIAISSGVGTGLAAIAAYGDGTVQAWLALTTALVATFLRLLEGFRIESSTKKKIATARNLRGLLAWWDSLGPRADTREHRDWLVEQAETILLDEVDSWAQQFGQALEDMQLDATGDKKSKGEQAAIDAAKERESATKLSALKEINFEALSVESLMRALGDPQNSQGLSDDTIKKLSELKQKLAPAATRTRTAKHDKEISTIQSEALEELRRDQGQSQEGASMQVFSQMKFLSLEDALTLPAEIEDWLAVNIASVGKAFTGYLSNKEGVAKIKNMSFHSAFEVLKDFVPHEIEVQLEEMPYRQILELCKRIVCEKLLSTLLDKEPNLRKFSSPNATSEDILSHFIVIAKTPHVTKFTHRAILELIQDPRLRHELATAPDSERIVEELLKASLKMLPTSDAEPAQGDSAARSSIADGDEVNLFYLFERFCAMISEIDIDKLMKNVDNGVALASAVEALDTCDVSPSVLRKEDMLAVFPAAYQCVLQSRSHFQLASYVSQVLPSKPSLSSIKTILRLYHEIDSSSTGTTRPKIFPASLLTVLSQSKKHQVVFANAVERLTQRDILEKPKTFLLRLMNLAGSPEVERELTVMPTIGFRLILSMIQTLHMNTFGAAAIDSACDSIAEFSLRSVLNYENVVRFVSKLPELRVQNFHSLASKFQQLRLFGYPELVESLDHLSTDQIAQLFYVFQDVVVTDWTTLQVAVLLRESIGDYVTHEQAAEIHRWSGNMILRLLWASKSISRSSLTDKAPEQHQPHLPRRSAGRRSTCTRRQSIHADPLDHSPLKRDVPVDKPSRKQESLEVMGDAYDEVIIQGMPSLLTSPDLVRKLFLTVQPLGVEADVASLFGQVLAQGGYDEKTVKCIQSVFGTWESRQVFVEALGNVMMRPVEGRRDPTIVDFHDLSPDEFVDAVIAESRRVSLNFPLADCDRNILDAFASLDAENAVLWPVVYADQRVKQEDSLTSKPPPVPRSERVKHLPHQASRFERLKERGIFPPQDISVPITRYTESELLTRVAAEAGDASKGKKSMKENLNDFLFNIVTDLRHGAPLYVFYRLASLCKFVDLRELFDTIELRTDFIVVLALGCTLLKKDGVTPLVNFESRVFSDFDSVDCIAMGVGDGQNNENQKEGVWRRDTLKALSELLESDLFDFDEAISVMYSFTEPLLRYVFECALKVFQSTMGRLLFKVIRYKICIEPLSFPLVLVVPMSKVSQQGSLTTSESTIIVPSKNITAVTSAQPTDLTSQGSLRMPDVSLKVAFSFDTAIATLVRFTKLFPAEVRQAFSRFDEAKFKQRDSADIKAVLSRWMTAGGDAPKNILSNLRTYDKYAFGQITSQSFAEAANASVARQASALNAMMQSTTYFGAEEFRQSKTPLLKRLFTILKLAVPDDDLGGKEKSSYTDETNLIKELNSIVAAKSRASCADTPGSHSPHSPSQSPFPDAFHPFQSPQISRSIEVPDRPFSPDRTVGRTSLVPSGEISVSGLWPAATGSTAHDDVVTER